MLRPRCRRCARAAGWVSVAGNLTLAALKWLAGLLCGSQALVADALHSSVDVLGSIITLVMLKLSRLRASDRYPYGLGKLEDIAAMAVYLILVGAGSFIVVDAIHSIATEHLSAPGLPALLTAAISVGVNIFMYFFISCAGRQANSSSLIALGYENKVDAMSSIAAMVGISGAMLGAPVLDPVAAIVVSGIIIVESLRELHKTACKLTDAALPPEVHGAIERAAASAPFVLGVLSVKSRSLGPASNVDVDVLVDSDICIEAAQAVAEGVADNVHRQVGDLQTVRVYTHPVEGATKAREARLDELLAVMADLRGHKQHSRGKA